MLASETFQVFVATFCSVTSHILASFENSGGTSCFHLHTSYRFMYGLRGMYSRLNVEQGKTVLFQTARGNLTGCVGGEREKQHITAN